MPERSIHTILSETFHHTSKEAWQRIASQELNEKKTIESLTWKIGDLSFNPYYDDSDLAHVDYLKKFRRFPAQPSHKAPQQWANMLKITVLGESQSNAVALHYLTGGADGVLFDATNTSEINLEILLDNIDLSICEVAFITHNNASLARNLSAYVKKKGYNLAELQGSIYYNSLITAKDSVLTEFSSFHSLGILVQPSSAVEEISAALFDAVQYIDSFTEMGLKKEQLIKTISLSFTAEQDFFLTIAKLKATRLLWYQVSQAFEIVNYVPEDLYIHLFAAPWTDEKFDPHGNMLKNTFQAIAGVLGGTNALTLSATDEKNEMLSRAALNVSNILKEEAYIDRVADPAAGAYALDNMVNTIAKAAWQNFLDKLNS